VRRAALSMHGKWIPLHLQYMEIQWPHHKPTHFLISLNCLNLNWPQCQTEWQTTVNCSWSQRK